MTRFSAVMDQLHKCRQLVEDASARLQAVEILKGEAKVNVEALLQQASEELNAHWDFRAGLP